MCIEYAQTSTLPGIKNLITTCDDCSGCKRQQQPRLLIGNLLRILIWAGTLLGGFALATIMIRISWSKYEAQPTITTIATAVHPVGRQPFPAVTVCETNKVFAPAALRIALQMRAHGLRARRVQQFLSKLQTLTAAIGPETELRTDTFDDVFAVMERMGYTVERFMHELMVPCTLLLAQCWWRGQKQPCAELFRVTTASDGFCCAFNFVPPLDSSLV